MYSTTKVLFIKEIKMKSLLAIVASVFALSAVAADPAATKAADVAKADATKAAEAKPEKAAKKSTERLSWQHKVGTIAACLRTK